jgi:hypothetical protein
MHSDQTKWKAGMRAVFRIFPRQGCKYTVKNVLWWLENLGVDNDTVMVPALCSKDLDATDHTTYLDNLRRIWELKGELIMGCKAQDVEARWVGGPPSDIRRHTGSFLQLLMDRILSDIASNGTRNFIRINTAFKKDQLQQKTPLTIIPNPAATCGSQDNTQLLRIGFDDGCAEWSDLR